METNSLKTFMYLEDGTIVFSNMMATRVERKLVPGLYVLELGAYSHQEGQWEVTIRQRNARSIGKVYFNDKEVIDKTLELFFEATTQELMNELGFKHKLGVLFHGAEGTGKTSIINNYCVEAIETKKALAFEIGCKVKKGLREAWEMVVKVRQNQQDPIIVIFDEFDGLLEGENESELKSMLDGPDSIESCLFFASTNYIDKIPRAIKDRPSRFKYLVKTEGIQNERDVRDIVYPLLKNYPDSVEEIILKHKGKTLDLIKDACLDKILNISKPKLNKKTIGF